MHLWPAGYRPFIDGSPDNSILNLIFGYNGLSRLWPVEAEETAPGFSGASGVFRLFNDLMGGQASWLLPASLLALVAGLVWRGRAPRTDRKRAALFLWGGWLLVTGAVFSFSSGVIHTYYTVALAPAIAALVGMGGAMMWQNRQRMLARGLGAAAIAATAVWAFTLLGRTPTYDPWLRPLILATGALGAVVLVVAPALPRLTRPLTAAAIGLGLAASLSGPIAFTATTLATAHTGSIASAGPAVSGGGFGGGGVGAPGGGQGGPGEALPGGGAGAGPGASGFRPSFAGGTRPAGAPTGGLGGTRPSGASSAAGTRGAPAGAGGSGGEGATTSAALTAALQSQAHRYRWVAATFGSQSAATLELASGEPVMAIGGFNGQGGNISLATFEAYVAKGDIHYFIASGSGGGGGPGGGTNSDSAITSWVEAHFTARTIGGQTVYDLTSPK